MRSALLAASDADLWRLMREDASEQAFGELFDRYADIVYNFCFRRLADWSAAEEATQEVFVALWQRTLQGRLDRLTGDNAAGLVLWQARMVVGQSRRAASRRMRLMQVATAEAREPDDPVQAWVESEANQRHITDAMASLPNDQRDVVELVCWAELSMSDAAVALDVPVGTVKSRLSRARAALRANAAQLMGEMS